MDLIEFPRPLRVDYYENTFWAQGWIDYRDQLEVEVGAYFGNLNRFEDKFFIGKPGGRGSAGAVFSGRTPDVELYVKFLNHGLNLMKWIEAQKATLAGLSTKSANHNEV